MPAALTPKQRLATILLGRPVHGWIAERRELGWTWRKIADDLRTATDGELDVTSEALRLWHEEAAA
jgi:hypothetical protein